MNTPGCLTCGYVVDFLRSCYESTWRLFSNDPRTTAGRYYFSDPDAPHYPGLHNFGSRNWTSDEREPPPALGETDQIHRPYSKGGLPIPRPPAVRLGDQACIEQGERFPLPMLDRFFVAGIDSRCYPIGLAPPAPSDLCSCSAVDSTSSIPILIDTAPCSCSTVAAGLLIGYVWPTAPCSCSTVTTTIVTSYNQRTTSPCSCSTLGATGAFPKSLPCSCSTLGETGAFPKSLPCSCSTLGATGAFPKSLPCSCSTVTSTHVP